MEQLQGFRTDLELIQELTSLEQLFADAEGEYQEGQQDREQIEIDRILREEQEAAYQTALATDRQREEAVREAKEAEENLQREEARRLREEKEKEESLKTQLETRRRNLSPEPTGEGINLAFRLTNGKRLKRKFAPNQPISALYDFVDTHSDNDLDASVSYTFESNYPKRSFPPSSSTLVEMQVPNNTVLEMILI